MKDYSGLRLTPLFYSEISSSYMLYDIFENHRDILSKFVEQTFNVVPEIKFIQRERQYPQKGSIDIFIEFVHSGKEKALLEGKGYLSLTHGKEPVVSNFSSVAEENEGIIETIRRWTALNIDSNSICIVARTNKQLGVIRKFLLEKVFRVTLFETGKVTLNETDRVTILNYE